MTRSAGRVTALALILLITVLAGFIVNRLLHPPRLKMSAVAVGADQAAEGDTDGQQLQNLRVPPLTEYSGITERPLFLDTRRPPPPEAKEVTAPTETVEQTNEFTLVGVMMLPDGERAILEVDEQGTVKRLKVGDEVKGWALKSIFSDKVVLGRGDETRDIALVRNKPSPSRARRIAILRKKNQQALLNRQKRQQQAKQQQQQQQLQQQQLQQQTEAGQNNSNRGAQEEQRTEAGATPLTE